MNDWAASELVIISFGPRGIVLLMSKLATYGVLMMLVGKPMSDGGRVLAHERVPLS